MKLATVAMIAPPEKARRFVRDADATGLAAPVMTPARRGDFDRDADVLAATLTVAARFLSSPDAALRASWLSNDPLSCIPGPH
jgi:hypothetical protein